MNSNQPDRYHLTVTGHVAAHGWWGSETVARAKMTKWIGDWGRPGARITLTDQETGDVLTTWPDEA